MKHYQRKQSNSMFYRNEEDKKGKFFNSNHPFFISFLNSYHFVGKQFPKMEPMPTVGAEEDDDNGGILRL